jgi:hypothetical protein
MMIEAEDICFDNSEIVDAWITCLFRDPQHKASTRYVHLYILIYNPV